MATRRSSDSDLLALLLPSSPGNTLQVPNALPTLDLTHDDFQHLRNYLPADDDLPMPMGMPVGVSGTKHKLSESPAHVQKAAGFAAALSPIGRDEATGAEHCDKRQRRVPWTHTEDVTILALHRHLGTNWDAIAGKLPGRTSDAVRNRCFRLQKQHPIATSEEGVHALDGLLLATHGIEPPTAPADAGAAAAGGKAPARAHHAEHQRHAWSADEDRIIVDGVQQLGCKWREIAKFLPGRTDSSIRNRWMRLQKEKFNARKSGEESPVKPAARGGGGGGGFAPATLGSAAAAAASASAPVEIAAVDATLGSPPKLAAGEVPLGLEKPFERFDLDSFAAVAFETLDELSISPVKTANGPPAPAPSSEPVVDLVEGEAPGENHAARHKLQAALVGVFAAMSIGAAGALASARRR